MLPTLMGCGSSMAGTMMAVLLLSIGALLSKGTVVIVVVGAGAVAAGGAAVEGIHSVDSLLSMLGAVLALDYVHIF